MDDYHKLTPLKPALSRINTQHWGLLRRLAAAH